MNKNLVFGIFAALVIVVAFVMLRAPQNKGEVVLGVVAGTTGEYAAAGEGYVKGFELARNEWNMNNRLQFRAVIEDDGFNAQKGVSAYQKLKNVDNPDAYAIVSSFTIDAIAASLIEEGKPVALGFEQSTAAEDDVIFQVFPAARPIQEGLGKYVKEKGYSKPFVFVSKNTPVYQNFAAGFVDGYGPGVLVEKIGGDVADARIAATKALASKADVIVFYTAPSDGAILAREIIRQAGNQHPQLAFDQSVQSGAPDYEAIFGKGLTSLNGSMVVLSLNELSDDFKEAYTQKYSSEAPFGSDIGYNSFMLLATTYDNDPVRWANNMRKARFEGADGAVHFNAVGLRVPNTAVARLQEGTLVFEE